MNRNLHWILFLATILGGGVFIYYLHQNFRQNEIEARNFRLETVHNRVINQFSNSVTKFAGLVSGMRSYVNLSHDMPSSEELQKFVQNQFDDIESSDSIVVSYIDTLHVFRYSFTRNEMDPVQLVGRSVSSLRSVEKLEALDRLFEHDGLFLYPPLNLFEGWVGIPLNFRVNRDGSTLGYVAPILNFKSVIQGVYNDELKDEFVFRFVDQEGNEFDRERVYNNTMVYNTNEDPEYYRNYSIDSTAFIYTKKEYFGYEISVGTAYKDQKLTVDKFFILLWAGYSGFILLGLVITLQIGRFKRLNGKLKATNRLLNIRQIKIDDQNTKLTQLTHTQNQFFSIIGHDIKQRLNAIEGLLHLLEKENIEDSDLKDIIIDLSTATANTTALLNNLLRWAMSQTGDIQFNPGDIDLTKVMKKELETLRYQAAAKHIRIEENLEEEVSYQGDRDMLQTVFRNLVSNAIKYSNLGGDIHISLQKEKDDVQIKIKDFGIGMSIEQINQLFVIGEVSSTLGTTGELGTGLGLKLAYNFIQRHKGRLMVESNEGEGSEFIIYLPL